MANVMRWRYGDTKPVMADVDSGQTIEIGDFCWLNTDDVRSAAAQSDQGSEVTNQETFADNFLGVAMQQSRSADTDEIRLATAGVFEFICASATYEVGDLVGVDEASSGTALEDQTVAAVTDAEYAIGRVARRATSATTTLFVEIESTVMHGGIAGGTPSG